MLKNHVMKGSKVPSWEHFLALFVSMLGGRVPSAVAVISAAGCFGEDPFPCLSRRSQDIACKVRLEEWIDDMGGPERTTYASGTLK